MLYFARKISVDKSVIVQYNDNVANDLGVSWITSAILDHLQLI